MSKDMKCQMTRLWRVPATLPYPDFIFTTRTLPGKVLKISGFRVVTKHAVSIQDYINDASYFKFRTEDDKIFHIPQSQKKQKLSG